MLITDSEDRVGDEMVVINIHTDLIKPKLTGNSSDSIGVTESSQSMESAVECLCRQRVLIVDDNHFNLFTLKSLIQSKFDVQIDEAINGQIAFNKY